MTDDGRRLVDAVDAATAAAERGAALYLTPAELTDRELDLGNAELRRRGVAVELGTLDFLTGGR